MKLYKSVILFLIITASSVSSFSQVVSAYIGIDGLTCSMCSNTVEKSIQELSFVKEIKMNLNETTAIIYFKENEKADLNKLAKKVKDAGYSLRFTKATIVFESTSVKEREITRSGDIPFYFISMSKPVSDTTEATLIGKDFIARKEYTQWKSQIKEAKSSISDKSIIYFVVN